MNWTYRGKEIKTIEDLPKGVFGFIYVIQDENNKIYIGKKQIETVRNVEVSEAVYKRLKSEGHRVERTKNKTKSTKTKTVWRFKKTIIDKESWIDYTGSSVPLNKKIKKGLKYKKEILHFCYKKKQCSYYEIKEQFIKGVIEEGNNSWNENILGKFYARDLKQTV